MSATVIGVVSLEHGHAWGYLDALLRLPGVEVVVADSDGARRRELAASPFGSRVRVVATTEELYRAAPRGVVVCTDNRGHAAAVAEAARHGVAVLCEKPLATDADAARVLSEAVRAAGIPFLMAYPTRHTDAFLGLRSLLAAGSASRFSSFHARNSSVIPQLGSWFLDEDAAGGGAIMDHVVHVADLVDQLFEVAPVEVTAVASPVRPDGVGVEVGAFVSLRYADGAVGSIDCSWREPLATGSWGGLDMELCLDGHFLAVDFYPDAVERFDDLRRSRTRLRPADASVPRLVAHFVAVARGEAAASDDLAAGERSLAIALAARESARTGRPVSLG